MNSYEVLAAIKAEPSRWKRFRLLRFPRDWGIFLWLLTYPLAIPLAVIPSVLGCTGDLLATALHNTAEWVMCSYDDSVRLFKLLWNGETR